MRRNSLNRSLQPRKHGGAVQPHSKLSYLQPIRPPKSPSTGDASSASCSPPSKEKKQLPDAEVVRDFDSIALPTSFVEEQEQTDKNTAAQPQELNEIAPVVNESNGSEGADAFPRHDSLLFASPHAQKSTPAKKRNDDKSLIPEGVNVVSDGIGQKLTSLQMLSQSPQQRSSGSSSTGQQEEELICCRGKKKYSLGPELSDSVIAERFSFVKVKEKTGPAQFTNPPFGASFPLSFDAEISQLNSAFQKADFELAKEPLTNRRLTAS